MLPMLAQGLRQLRAALQAWETRALAGLAEADQGAQPVLIGQHGLELHGVVVQTPELVFAGPQGGIDQAGLAAERSNLLLQPLLLRRLLPHPQASTHKARGERSCQHQKDEGPLPLRWGCPGDG